jgi:hypothetical protein
VGKGAAGAATAAVAAAVGAAAAAAFGLKNRLRLCNLLSLSSRFSVGEAALPTRTITVTSTKVKHAAHTTAGVSLDPRPICISFRSLSDDVFIASPPLVTCFELLPPPYTRSACALKSARITHPLTLSTITIRSLTNYTGPTTLTPGPNGYLTPTANGCWLDTEREKTVRWRRQSQERLGISLLRSKQTSAKALNLQ